MKISSTIQDKTWDKIMEPIFHQLHCVVGWADVWATVAEPVLVEVEEIEIQPTF